MLRYVLRRLFSGLVLAVLVTLITFLLLVPSFDDVVGSRIGLSATPEAIAALKADMGLDRPVMVQYLDWLSGAVRGDLGASFFSGEPVSRTVGQHLGVTLSIVVVTLLLTVAVSITLGVLAASRGGAVDKITQAASLTGHLVPNLLIAIGLVYLLAIKAKLLPATGFTPMSEDPVAWARTITIPVVALLVGSVAGLTAQVRGTMIGELRKDYVRTLRTRGISHRSVVLRHALRNAAGPALTVLSFEFIALLGGALIIEKVFAIPGFGSFAFDASLQGDVPVIMGITLFAVLLVVTVNLAVDLANGWLNPKARIF
ncbi:peptide/nickel transport system permease protein [Actinocorallia herbida]|uniref:Peptide/nickel transport system permease protein n=1 Tax=Actinocorallia herbida TaxID=58109 RepID=A0A3N1D1C8_9ACTN|nr:ABC transporter permease [Actinocorallia herbida]ROO87333.1 peptide/nickel transport system permease protein [Actinocorallia herbida]